MKAFQRDFLEFALECGALRFGEFTLKSWRVSPFFFNAGEFNSGRTLGRLAGFYADAILDSGMGFDILYGPAYKGIPLAAATAVALSARMDKDIPYAFNRKESKRHGEGGLIVGHRLEGRVLIIDDVMSAGTSVRESIDIIRTQGATPCGVAIALDRQERGRGALSAVQEVASMGIPVISIAALDTLFTFLSASDGLATHRAAVAAYREKYGAV